MKTNDLVATTAISLGVSQMFMNLRHVYVRDDVSGYSFPSVLVGITASALWMTYQFNSGANYSVVYTSIGLVVQMYILQRLIAKAKEDTQSKM